LCRLPGMNIGWWNWRENDSHTYFPTITFITRYETKVIVWTYGWKQFEGCNFTLHPFIHAASSTWVEHLKEDGPRHFVRWKKDRLNGSSRPSLHVLKTALTSAKEGLEAEILFLHIKHHTLERNSFWEKSPKKFGGFK
jgi:hypothetical protein